MAAPLAGMKVLEISTMITAPLAGMLLSDMGADVIKVENPKGGDPFRSFRGGLYSPHFCAYNRNKRSVALDLQTDDGKRVLARLVERSDVLLENFRPGVLDRLGFNDERLVQLNGRLIRCHISGFGATGPYAARPAYDAVAQALSGMSSLFLEPSEPQVTGPTISDNVTGLYACYGVMAALLQREKRGTGRRIDVNMLDATLAFMPDPFSYFSQMGLVSDPLLRARTSQSYAFRCADEKLLTIHLSSQDRFWEEFVTVIERPDLLDNELTRSRADRIENYQFIRDVAAKVFVSQPRSYWLDRLAKHDLPFAPVYDVTEVPDDPQVQYLDSFASLDHPVMGMLRSIRRPVLLDGKRDDQPLNPPPMLGEHTEAVLRELGINPLSITERKPENSDR